MKTPEISLEIRFLKYAIPWLEMEGKATGQGDVAKNLDNFDSSSMSAALNGKRPFPGEKFTLFLDRYDLHQYWRTFQKDTTTNPFIINKQIDFQSQQRGHSPLDRIAALEMQNDEMIKLLKTICTKFNITMPQSLTGRQE